MKTFLELSLLAQLFLLSVLITSILLLVNCLHSWYHKGLWCGCVGRRARQEDTRDANSIPHPNLEIISSPCPKITLEEVESFYQILHAPTEGKMMIKQLLNKLLVYLCKELDHRGGCLMLTDMAISLTIPPGAIALGRTEKISLVLVWDLSDSPQLSSSQALVSPVVYCGPHGTSFQKPSLLAFKHCAGNATQIKVYSSYTPLHESKSWHPIGSQDGLRAETTRDECRIQLSHFSLYTCVLEAPWKVEACKWLQLAVFCSPLAAGQSHLQVRVYFLNNTPCALQWALNNEQPFQGSLRGPVQLFNFSGKTKDIFLNLKYISDGWENVDESSYQSIPHIHIWHGKCPFRSFCFRKNQNGEAAVQTNEIIVTMHIYQNGLQKKYVEVLRFQALESGLRLPKISPAISCNRIPRELFEQLQMLLEPNSISGNDWRKLASRLGMCGMKIRYFSCQQSPAAATLELFEEQNGNLKDLYNILIAMDRADCALAVENYLNGAAGGHSCSLAVASSEIASFQRERQNDQLEIVLHELPLARLKEETMGAFENLGLDMKDEII